MSAKNIQINEQARKEANLRLLQRSMDKSIVDILGSATHVVLYNFDTSTNAWQKSNVEGSLFLCLKADQSYTLVILNRNAPDNYPMALTKDFQVQLSDPYLIFRNKDASGVPIIRGVWFPNANERTALNELLQQVLVELQTAKVAVAAPAVDTASATAALLASLNVGGTQQQSASPALPPRSTSTGSRNSSTGSLRQPSPTSANQQPSLDKKSLQLALLSLIQDDRFLDLLHAQYLKVHHARTAKNGQQSQQQTPR